MFTILFLTKGKDWEYEEEWRMLRSLKDADEIKGDIHLFSIPPSCVTGIIFGCNVLEAKKKEVIHLLQYNTNYSHVKRYQAVLSEKNYAVNIVVSDV